MTFLRRAARRLMLAACLLPLAAALPAVAQDPVSFTMRTVDNDAGMRVILEFTRKPRYEVRGDGRRLSVILREIDVRPPFRKRKFDTPILERVKFAEGFRTSEIVFYTGPDFGTYSTFEMGEPFRLVIDLRRRPQAPPAGRPGTPGGGPGAPAAEPAGPGGEGGALLPPLPPAAGGPGAVEGPGKGKTGFLVVIDPGHGGEEEGARGPTGLLEKDVTLDIAKRLRSRLEGDPGTRVLMTRDDDRKVALDDRTALANHAHADLFVSIHANSSRRDTARGAETYFLSAQATDDDARAVAALENNPLQLDKGVQSQTGLEMVLWDLAQSAFLKESSDLAEMIQDSLNDTLGVRNRGIRQAPFRVLMGATMPAVLVEVSFISSPEEEKRLRDAAYKDQIATAIAQSVRKFREKFLR